MKLTIARDELLRLLQQTTPVVERRQTLPVLANVMFEVNQGLLRLTASDQEVEVRASTTDFSMQAEGETTLPGRKLLDIIRHLPGTDPVEIALDGQRASVGSGSFTSLLATLPAIEFPTIEGQPVQTDVRLAAQELLALLNRTSYAMATQDVRYFFNGTLLEFESGLLRAVATNGQRLAISELPLPESSVELSDCIVPRKAVLELQRLLAAATGEVRLKVSDNHIEVQGEGLSVSSLLIDASYPDYRSAVPEAGDKLLRVDRVRFREALIRAAILSNEVYKNVRLSLQDNLIDISTNNPLQEEAREQVACEYDAAALEIGFNVMYLTETLGVMIGSVVEIRFSDSNSACLLTDPDDIDSRYVISPMML